MKQTHEHTEKQTEDEIDRFLKMQTRKARRGTMAIMLMVAALLLVATVALMHVDYSWLGRLFKPEALAPHGLPLNESVKTGGCDAVMPAHSSIHVTTPFKEFRDDFPLLEIVNRHAYPIMVRITSPDEAVIYQSVSVHAGKNTVLVDIPPGEYGIVVMTGAQWCNLKKGFLDGAVIRAERLLEMQAGKNERLTLLSHDSSPSGLHMTIEEWGVSNKEAPNHVSVPASSEPDAVKKAPVKPLSKKPNKKTVTAPTRQSSGLRQQEQERCYDYYAQVRDQIIERMQFSSGSRPGESFREDLNRNEINYQECLSRLSR